MLLKDLELVCDGDHSLDTKRRGEESILALYNVKDRIFAIREYWHSRLLYPVFQMRGNVDF